MPCADSAALADLKAALLKLEATGPKGFEGLLATALSTVTGLTFRLASAGTQDGEDGSAGATITFEGKLYTSSIPKSEVLSKITDLIARTTPPELWILGATVAAGSQKVSVIERAATKNGIATLILDWVASAPMPALAVLCTAASDVTRQFIADQLDDRKVAEAAASALMKLAASPTFATERLQLLTYLTEASLGLPQAQAANRLWLEAVFTDRRQAVLMLGQPLAPRAQGPHPVLARTDLVQLVTSALAGAPAGHIVAILGGEGSGKSWLLAQGWHANPQLMVLISAQEVHPSRHGADFEDQLISKLIAQAGERSTAAALVRWQERLKRWATTPTSTPRFLLTIDGLNQRADSNWARWLDAIAVAVERLGGVLVITARRIYFEDHIQSALASDVVRIDVPEWTDAEVNAILRSVKLEDEPVTPEVRQRLRNPRLLGIALDLLSQNRIKTLVELSVQRLLFEQIRAGAQDGSAQTDPRQFTRTLSDHAREILDRVEAQRHFDRLIFDSRATSAPHTLSADLLAVAGEHFFHPLHEDPTRYRLTDDGLVLALGLALLDGLKGAERNQFDVEEALATILDPIAALDKTAEAVIAASHVASIDDRTSAEIRTALVGASLQLQNIDDHAFASIGDMLPSILPEALATLERFALAERYVQNLDWLVSALRDLRADPAHWSVIHGVVVQWLRTYSRNPELGAFTRGLDDAEAQKRRNQSRERQDRLWSELTVAERQTFEMGMLRRDNIDPGKLHSIAFKLLAGMPLAPFAEDLVANALSEALNSRQNSSYDAFVTLLRFNVADGPAAREAFRLACGALASPAASTTARWARVAVLGGLSTDEDGAAARQLVEVLTADREHRPGWRRIEDYCATDPCDPNSVEPENIVRTAKQFETLDVATLRKGVGVTQEDHFLAQALPGIARFRPAVGIATIRRYAAATPTRPDELQKFLLTDLAPQSAALGRIEVDGLINVSNRLNRRFEQDDRKGSDTWVAAQYALMAAFPHLTGDEQLSVLLAPNDPGSLLLKTIPLLKPASAQAIEAAMAELESDDGINRKLAVLLVARLRRTDLSEVSRKVAERLAQHPNSYVRSEAMAALLASENRASIKAVVSSGWTAYRLDVAQSAFETWRGSLVLVRALELDLLPVEEALDRISPLHYGSAAATGVSGVEAALAERLRLALLRALKIDLPRAPPYAEQRAETNGGDYPPMFSLAAVKSTGGDEGFERHAEDSDAFHRRLIARHNAFNAFDAKLTEAGARLIIDNAGFRAIEVCVRKVEGWGETLAGELLALPVTRRSLARNFALMLAKVLSDTAPETAAKLMSSFTASRGFTGLVFGPAQVPLVAVCTWDGGDNPIWDALRTARLDQAGDDATLAEEVLAALSADKSAFLEQYAALQLVSGEPVRQARGLMVLGLGAPRDFAEAELRRFNAMEGFLGEAAGAAQYAYERNEWARHWRRAMVEATTPEEYWAASILFKRIVDGRVSYWRDLDAAAGSIAERFDPTVQGEVEHRVKHWQDKRKKTLFGCDTPSAPYLEPPVQIRSGERLRESRP